MPWLQAFSDRRESVVPAPSISLAHLVLSSAISSVPLRIRAGDVEKIRCIAGDHGDRYSSRNAVTGSRPAARHAGMAPAARPTRITIPVVAIMVVGSVAETP